MFVKILSIVLFAIGFALILFAHSQWWITDTDKTAIVRSIEVLSNKVVGLGFLMSGIGCFLVQLHRESRALQRKILFALEAQRLPQHNIPNTPEEAAFQALLYDEQQLRPELR